MRVFVDKKRGNCSRNATTKFVLIYKPNKSKSFERKKMKLIRKKTICHRHYAIKEDGI